MSSTRDVNYQGYPGGQAVPPAGAIPMNAQAVPIAYGTAQPQIIVNQVTPAVTVAIPAMKATPYLTVCPYCRNQVMTSSIQTFNCCTCLLCWCTGLIWFCIIQSIRGKDIGCYDAVHKCPNCGQTIGIYESC